MIIKVTIASEYVHDRLLHKEKRTEFVAMMKIMWITQFFVEDVMKLMFIVCLKKIDFKVRNLGSQCP